MSRLFPKVSNVYNVGVNPSFCAVTSDSKFAYVTNSNNLGLPNGNSVTVLNLQTKLTEVTIRDPSFNGPYRVAIDQKDKYAYVCNSESPSEIGKMGTVSVIELKNNRVSSVISGFDGPSGVVLGKSFLYVLNFGASGGAGMYNGKTISVVDLNTNTITATIQVDLAPQGMALSQDEKYLFVICYVDGVQGNGTLTIIDTTTNISVAKMNGLFGPFFIALSKCGSYAFVSNFGSNNFSPTGHTVAVISIQDVKNPQIKKEIHKLGIQPSGLAVSKDGQYLFVSNYNALYAHKNFTDLTYGSSTVNIIRIQDLKVIGPTLEVGETASSLTLTPDGKTLLVPKFVQNTVGEIQLENKKSTINLFTCCF